MCTVSFAMGKNNSVYVGGNRDEQKSRPAGKPPELHQIQGMDYLSPTDSKAGGTWIAVNKRGLTLCLLNRYQGNKEQPFKDAEPPSRGFIIPAFIHHSNIDSLVKDIELQLKPEQYRPFTLIGFSSNPAFAYLWDWNGETFTTSDKEYGPALWVSSGYNQNDVQSVRQSTFRTFLDESGQLDLVQTKKLHSSQIPEQGAFSIAMILNHVQTVSSTIVEIQEKAVLMHYHHGYPTLNGKWSTLSLARD